MDEEKTNEAEQKKHDLTASIERMTEKLENIFSTATQAIQHAPNLESEAHKWMVLSKSLGEIRHILGPCTIMPDACFHKVYEIAHPPTAAGTGGGAFFTPKQAIDFIMGNPPFDPNAPQIALGEEPWRKIGTDSVGVKNTSRLCQAWVVREGASVEVRAERQYVEGMQTSCWSLVATVDLQKALVGTVFGSVNRAKSVCQKLRNALIAVRLRGRHYRMNVQARKAKAAEEVPNA